MHVDHTFDAWFDSQDSTPEKKSGAIRLKRELKAEKRLKANSLYAFDSRKGHQFYDKNRFKSLKAIQVSNEMWISKKQFKSIEDLKSHFVADLNKAFGSETHQVRKAAKFIYVNCKVLHCECSMKFSEKNDGTITCVQKIAQYHSIKAHYYGQLKQEVRTVDKVTKFSR